MKNLIYFLIPLVLVSCIKDEKLTPDKPKVTDKDNPQTLIDVVYGSDKLNKMDIYLPSNRSTVSPKVFIMLHGGAWVDDDKSGSDDPHYKTLVDSIKLKYPDWAIFNINYRLATITGNFFPTQEEDVKKAIQYIFDNRSEFGISDKWVYIGMSAGAHLAMLQGYKNTIPIAAKAIIDFYGPTDMTALYNYYLANEEQLAFAVSKLLRGTPSSNASLYYSSSPINFIKAQSPPTLILQGGKDDTVPEAQSLALSAKLKAAGVITEYGDEPLFAYQTHGWSDPALWVITMKRIDKFIKSNVP